MGQIAQKPDDSPFLFRISRSVGEDILVVWKLERHARVRSGRHAMPIAILQLSIAVGVRFESLKRHADIEIAPKG
jgi:hypothetical protein